MTAPTCTFGPNLVNVNDGTIYTMRDGVSMGSTVKTWADYRGYDGSVAQYNVTSANAIDVTIPLMVMGTSASDLRSHLVALNTEIDLIVPGVSHLVYEGTTYHLLTSPHVEWTEDTAFINKFFTFVTLSLRRQP